MSSKPKEFCKRGHLMAETRKKYGRGGVCSECVKITSAEYYRTHKEQQQKHKRRYYEANKEKVIARQGRRYIAKRDEIRLYHQKHYLANRPKMIRYRLIYQLKKQYGMTLQQYNAMLAAQHGICAICKKPPSKRRLDVDHDHADGHVRQLLCERCNKGLGCFEDSLELLEAAVRYMRKHSQLRLVG
jgi:hypothetical protein